MCVCRCVSVLVFFASTKLDHGPLSFFGVVRLSATVHRSEQIEVALHGKQTKIQPPSHNENFRSGHPGISSNPSHQPTALLPCQPVDLGTSAYCLFACQSCLRPRHRHIRNNNNSAKEKKQKGKERGKEARGKEGRGKEREKLQPFNTPLNNTRQQDDNPLPCKARPKLTSLKS